ncbi:MAG TPA: hypothetical protein VKS44_00195 [Candidatus Acidoferrales bacterium]|nr:hypothetical protein [Candidatus Acidoferrales bacterium]
MGFQFDIARREAALCHAIIDGLAQDVLKAPFAIRQRVSRRLIERFRLLVGEQNKAPKIIDRMHEGREHGDENRFRFGAALGSLLDLSAKRIDQLRLGALLFARDNVQKNLFFAFEVSKNAADAHTGAPCDFAGRGAVESVLQEQIERDLGDLFLLQSKQLGVPNETTGSFASTQDFTGQGDLPFD